VRRNSQAILPWSEDPPSGGGLTQSQRGNMLRPARGPGRGVLVRGLVGALKKNQTVSSGVARDRDWRGRHKVQVSAESFEPNRDPLRARSGLGPPPSGGVSP
jgi:hypothetical protein